MSDKNLGNTLGKAGGEAAGRALGAKAGGAIGTAISPGLGTAIGTALGTGLGSAIGGWAGDKLGGAAADAADKALAKSDWENADILRAIIAQEDPSTSADDFKDWKEDELKQYIKDVHGYSPEEQDDIINRVKTSTDVDNDGNIDVITTDSNGDGDADEAEVKPGKGNKKAKELAKEALSEENDSPLENMDSTGTITDDDSDTANVIKDTLLSIKY